MQSTTLSFLILISFSSGWMGCTGPPRPTKAVDLRLPAAYAGRQSECLPIFPDEGGWYGGDAAYSVPLPLDHGRASLWLFGDSFVERQGEHPGRVYPYVHNSIGISHCGSDGIFRLETFWRKNPPAEPRAFFVPDRDAEWVRKATRESDAPPHYWLFDGFIAHDTLFIGLLRVVGSGPRGPFNLPFRLVGMDLARIENHRDRPDQWRIQISTLSNDLIAFPGSAFVETNSYLHAFAFIDRGDGRSPRMLGRIELDKLARWQPDLSGEFEYWSKDSIWKVGFEPEDAMILMNDDASEMSVHFDTESERWFAVYSDPMRDQISDGLGFLRIRSASMLTGPWSEPRNLASIPESLSESTEGRKQDVFCYAGKAHPQFSAPGEVVVTYVCSLYARKVSDSLAVLEQLVDRPSLYRPRAIRIVLPEEHPQETTSD